MVGVSDAPIGVNRMSLNYIAGSMCVLVIRIVRYKDDV